MADDPTPGVTVLDLASARAEMPELAERHLGSLVPIDRAGSEQLTGTFVHVAAGVQVNDPLQTFFGRDAERMAPMNRTLLVAEAGSSVAYIEGCAAPIYTSHTDRSSIVELIVGPGAMVRHTTIQNWSANVRNAVTKHASVGAEGSVEWVDAALGSSATTTRLVTRLGGQGASGSVLSMISAGAGQRHDAEVNMVHEGPNTASTMLTKLLGSDDGAITSRHRVHLASNGSQAQARSETLRLHGLPTVDHTFEATGAVGGGDVGDRVDTTSTDGRVEDLHVEYLMRRGLSRVEAVGMVVTGYLEPIARTLPLEYAIEWERSIQLQMGQAIG